MASLKSIVCLSILQRASRLSIPTSSLLTPNSSFDHGHSRTRAGMTMIELCLVMGIVTLLMAMVVGLNRHVNEIVKIRRAQADLGEWHEVFNRWFVQFGEYPYENRDTATSTPLLDKMSPALNLSNVLERCEIRLADTRIYFSNYVFSAVSTTDPWGSPYIYDCDPGGKSYLLYSCGPDSRSVLNGQGIPDNNDSAYTRDDVYLIR